MNVSFRVQVVFDVESDPGRAIPIGLFDHADEDVIVYRPPLGGRYLRTAPADCVQVRTIDVAVSDRGVDDDQFDRSTIGSFGEPGVRGEFYSAAWLDANARRQETLDRVEGRST